MTPSQAIKTPTLSDNNTNNKTVFDFDLPQEVGWFQQGHWTLSWPRDA
jgi:hypothetical protein